MSIHAFIGRYTNTQYGITHVNVTDDGKLELAGVTEGVDNPIYFALNKAKDRLYVTQGAEIGAPRSSNGAVAVYAVAADKSLTLLDKRAYPFSVPCHLSLNHAGDALVFAEYSGAHPGVIGLRPDGTFEPGNGVIAHHEGHGPNAVRQESAHAHCAILTPDDSILMICDLGIDTVVAYDFASWRGGLRRRPESDIHTAPGAGPRHLIFDASGHLAYLVNGLGFAGEYFLEGLELGIGSVFGDSLTGFHIGAEAALGADHDGILADVC